MFSRVTSTCGHNIAILKAISIPIFICKTVCMCNVCVPCLCRQEEGVRYIVTGVTDTDGCELTCGCWKLNSSLFQGSFKCS